MQNSGIELMAELHQTGTFEGRSTDWATQQRQVYLHTLFNRFSLIPVVFFGSIELGKISLIAHFYFSIGQIMSHQVTICSTSFGFFRVRPCRRKPSAQSQKTATRATPSPPPWPSPPCWGRALSRNSRSGPGWSGPVFAEFPGPVWPEASKPVSVRAPLWRSAAASQNFSTGKNLLARFRPF